MRQAKTKRFGKTELGAVEQYSKDWFYFYTRDLKYKGWIYCLHGSEIEFI